MQADAYLAQLQQLLPTGPGLPREADSPLIRLLGVPAAELARVDGRAADMLLEALPDTTNELLAEWERAFGLPDPCTAGLTLVQQRRAALVARVTERLSPTPATIEAVALAFGVRASVIEYRQHNCEQSCEAPVTDAPWVHAFTVWGSGRSIFDFTCQDDCEEPLRAWTDLPHECAVRRLAPAHTVPLFGSFQNEWSFLGGLPAGATFTRAAPADRINSRGLVESVGANLPRMGYRSGLTYNQALNPWGDGVTIGGLISQPALGWGTIAGTAGLSYTVNAVGQEDDLPFIDVLAAGVTTNSQFPVICPHGSSLLPAAPGNRLSVDVHVRQVPSGGSDTWPATFQFREAQVIAFDAVPAILTAPGSGIRPAPPADGQPAQRRVRAEVASAPAGTALFGGGPRLFNVTSGNTVQVALRFAFPVINVGPPLADSVPLTTLAARIGTVQQYGLLGLMLEPSAGEALTLAVPDGVYTAQITGATPAGTVSTWFAPRLASVGGVLSVEWPASAVLAGANHLRSIILRKVT